MPQPLEVHVWDDIGGEVTKQYPRIDPEATHKEVIKATYKFIDYEPNQGERWIGIELPNLKLIAGKDEYGHHFMMWWGRNAQNFGHAAFETTDE